MTAPQDRQPATEWPQVLEYDAEGHWLILTDRLGPDEYGVSSIVARDVLHAFGLEAVARWEARAQFIAELREDVSRALSTFETKRRERYIHIGPVRTQASIDAPVVEVWADPQWEVADFTAAVLALIEKVAGE